MASGHTGGVRCGKRILTATACMSMSWKAAGQPSASSFPRHLPGDTAVTWKLTFVCVLFICAGSLAATGNYKNDNSLLSVLTFIPIPISRHWIRHEVEEKENRFQRSASPGELGLTKPRPFGASLLSDTCLRNHHPQTEAIKSTLWKDLLTLWTKYQDFFIFCSWGTCGF